MNTPTSGGWVDYINCPVCGANEFGQARRRIFFYPFMQAEFCNGIIRVATIVDYKICGGCGLQMQSPRMTDERIKYYYTSGLSRKCSGNSYEWMDEREHMRANSLIETLKKHGIEPKVHLDIGAGRGFFLEETRKNFGTEIYGIDLYEEYAKVDYKKDIDKPADLVSCIHTLEHCTEPVEELKNFRKMCSKYLIIEVPSGVKDSGLNFGHIFLFPKDLLVKMIEDAGFKIIEVEQNPETRILAEVC